MWVWSSGALGGDKSSEERQQRVGIRPPVLHQSVSPASGHLGWAPGGCQAPQRHRLMRSVSDPVRKATPPHFTSRKTEQ